MIPRLLRRFYLKPKSYQRDYIGIWQTNNCYIMPFISVTDIININKGKTYVRFGWLFWYLEYFNEGRVFMGCDEEESCENTVDIANNKIKRKKTYEIKDTNN